MPEEINRCVAGVVADVHCAPTTQAVANLRADGGPGEAIALTGNTIVEATQRMLPGPQAARQVAADAGGRARRLRAPAGEHRRRAKLEAILAELSKLGLPVLLPLHPRTRLAARRHGLEPALDRLVGAITLSRCDAD
jgi:UDP-N-acetylglucosamine 2-epimerase (non-hydrolysing)